jgi:hypothetical protein
MEERLGGIERVLSSFFSVMIALMLVVGQVYLG